LGSGSLKVPRAQAATIIISWRILLLFLGEDDEQDIEQERAIFNL
jgi:hypothetical protein